MTEDTPAAGGKKQRAKQKPRPVYIVLTVKDKNGNVLDISKDDVDILVATRDTGTILEAIDAGAAGSVYKQVVVT